MDHIDVLRLGDVHVFANWALAPLGTLLQMRLGDQTIVGMRANYETDNGAPDALLVLGDEYKGVLITDAHLSGAALDVTSQLEIVAVNPWVFNCALVNPLPHGALLQYPDKRGLYFVWIKVQAGSGSGGVCVVSNDPNCPVGTGYSRLDKNKLIGVGEVGLRLRDNLFGKS